MDRRKILFIYNPVAGRGQIRWALDDVLRIFTGAGLLPVCYPTSARGDAVRLIREIRDEAALAGTPFPYEMVICSGGDGTLDEVMKYHCTSDLIEWLIKKGAGITMFTMLCEKGIIKKEG